MNLKKLERYLRVNLLGPGPRLMKKEFTGPRSQNSKEKIIHECVKNSDPDVGLKKLQYATRFH